MGDILSNAQLQKAMDADLIQDVTDDDQSGSVDTDVLDEVIEQAEGTVYLYLASKYTLDTLTAAGKKMLRRLVTNIAIFDLYSRRMSVPDVIKTRYTETQNQLQQLARGELSLGANSTHKSPLMSSDQADEDRLFNFTDSDRDDFQDYP